MTILTKSPCVGLCHIDPLLALCRGCWRSLDDISAWSGLNDKDRQTIIKASLARHPGLAGS